MNMNSNWNISLALSMLLIGFGIAAFLSGEGSLLVLIPAAVLVWYVTPPSLRSGRN